MRVGASRKKGFLIRLTHRRTSNPPHAYPSLHRFVRSLPDRYDYSEDKYTRDSLQRKLFGASIPSKVANQRVHHAGHCVRSFSPFHVGDRSLFPNDTAQASLSQRGMNFKVVLPVLPERPRRPVIKLSREEDHTFISNLCGIILPPNEISPRSGSLLK